MLNLVIRSFKSVFKLLLWLNLIVFTIVFPALMTARYGNGSDSDVGFFVVRAIIGFPIGLLVNIIAGGIVVTLLRMDENLKLLVKLNGGEPVEQFPKT